MCLNVTSQEYDYDVREFGYFPTRMHPLNTQPRATVDQDADHQHIPQLLPLPTPCSSSFGGSPCVCLGGKAFVLSQENYLKIHVPKVLLFESSTGIDKIIVTGDVNLTFY